MLASSLINFTSLKFIVVVWSGCVSSWVSSRFLSHKTHIHFALLKCFSWVKIWLSKTHVKFLFCDKNVLSFPVLEVSCYSSILAEEMKIWLMTHNEFSCCNFAKFTHILLFWSSLEIRLQLDTFSTVKTVRPFYQVTR